MSDAEVLDAVRAGNLTKWRVVPVTRLVSMRDETGDPLVLVAAKNRQSRLLEPLLYLPQGSSVRNTFTGDTVLHYAAAIGDRDLAECVLRHGVTACLENKRGQTAADVATAAGHLELAAFLRSEAKDAVRGQAIIRSVRGPTKFRQPQQPAAAATLTPGAGAGAGAGAGEGGDDDSSSAAGGSAVVQQQAPVVTQTTRALFAAVEAGDRNVVSTHDQTLLTSAVNEHGEHLIHAAVRSSLHTQPQHAASRQDLLEFLMYTPGCAKSRNERTGETVLHLAARVGDAELVEFLLRHGASATIASELHMGETPADVARLEGHVELAERLEEEYYRQLKGPAIVAKRDPSKRYGTRQAQQAGSRQAVLRQSGHSCIQLVACSRGHIHTVAIAVFPDHHELTMYSAVHPRWLGVAVDCHPDSPPTVRVRPGLPPCQTTLSELLALRLQATQLMPLVESLLREVDAQGELNRQHRQQLREKRELIQNLRQQLLAMSRRHARERAGDRARTGEQAKAAAELIHALQVQVQYLSYWLRQADPTWQGPAP